MPFLARRTRAVLLLAVGVFASLLVSAVGSTAVAANDKGLVNGSITCPELAKCPSLKMLWFDADWHYLGEKSANGGGYSLTLPPGTYHLQFFDQRPAYDVSKFAPTDVQVSVHANQLTKKNVTMWKGAAVTGTVRGGGKALGGATIVAANKGEQSFSTTANGNGQFAIGGLPQGQYSLFTYDKKKVWVGTSTWAGSVKAGKIKNADVKLTKKAGNLTVYLFTPDGLLNTKTTLTVTSKQTGQWWSTSSGSGTFVFKGLYPGKYDVQFDGAGVWFAKTGTVEKASVAPGKMDFGSFHLTKRGGWMTGTVVDGGDGAAATDFAMKGVVVGLYDADGQQVASATTDEDGNFKLSGQLATQTGLTVAVDPNPNSGGWMPAAAPDNWCLFEGGEVSHLGITQGQQSEIGQVALPRSTASAQANQCLVPSGSASR